MTMESVRTPLSVEEFEALALLAESHLRPVPNEVRFIVREALYASGHLKRPEEGTHGPDR